MKKACLKTAKLFSGIKDILENCPSCESQVRSFLSDNILVKNGFQNSIRLGTKGPVTLLSGPGDRRCRLPVFLWGAVTPGGVLSAEQSLFDKAAITATLNLKLLVVITRWLTVRLTLVPGSPFLPLASALYWLHHYAIWQLLELSSVCLFQR